MPQRPRDWYAVGRKLPPGRKPRSAREIHLFQGYKPPRLMEMAANEAGDLLIVATDPKNRSPRGGSVKGTYHEELWDNWGNLYRRFYRHSPCCPAPGQDTINCMYYTPIGPFRRGEGRHTLALQYVVWDVDTGMSVQRVVSEEAADFPAPTVQGALPQWPPGSDFAAAKRRGLEEHLRSGQTLLKQLDYVEHKLAGRASSAPLIQWKVHLLKELGEDEQAWAFFERTFKDKAIAQPFRSYHSDQMLFDYLSRLWRGGRQEQAMVIIEKLRTASKAQSAARAGASRREVEDARQMLAQSPLLLWLEAPQALKDLSQKPTPKVERIVRSEDGQLCMAVRLPDAARSPLGRPIWGRPTTPPDGPWKDIVSFQKGDLLFMKLKGGGETIALVFDPAVASGTSPLQELRLPWTLEVPVPSATARNAEELEAAFPEWPARQRRASTQPASAFARAKDQARRLFADGEYEQALQWYRKALATPAGELPKMHETEKLNRYLQQRNVLWTHLAVARCLSRLRRFDEARRLLYSLDEKVRDPEAYAALPEPERRGDVFAALGEVISEMVDAGMLNEAEDLLTDIDRARPDFRRLDNLYVATDKPWGRSGRRPRADALRRWGAVDRAWWRLRKARVASSQPAKQAPRPAGGGGVR